MNRSSPVPVVVMQPQTMMLPPPCLTVGKAQFSWHSSPGRRHTCWTPSELKKFTLDSSDHRTCSSNSCSWTGCLQQTVCRLFCEPASEEAFFWDAGHANRLLAVCGVWSEHWQAYLPLLQPLKQCWQHSCICFFEAVFCTWHTAQGINFFDRPLQGLFWVKPVLENLCMTLATVL